MGCDAGSPDGIATHQLPAQGVLDAMDAYGLTRRKTYHRFIIEIILRLSIIDGTSHRLFQKECIKAERHLVRRLVFRAVEMHNAYQRMFGLKPEKTIILFYGIRFYYFHACKRLNFQRQIYTFIQYL